MPSHELEYSVKILHGLMRRVLLLGGELRKTNKKRGVNAPGEVEKGAKAALEKAFVCLRCGRRCVDGDGLRAASSI